MKKIFFIIFLFPILLFSQNKQQYQKTMTLSQFVKELKQAALQGQDYVLENCHVTYSNYDKKYLSDNDSRGVVDDTLYFNRNSIVRIENCRFGDNISQKTINSRGFTDKLGLTSAVLVISNMHFGELILDNVDVDIKIDNINADIGLTYNKSKLKPNTLVIQNSKINGLSIDGSNTDLLGAECEIKVTSSDVNFCIATNVKNFIFSDNKTSALTLDGKFDMISVSRNNFYADFKHLTWIRLKQKNYLEVGNFSGLNIGRYGASESSVVGSLELKDNIFNTMQKFTNDTILDIIQSYDVNKNRYNLLWTKVNSIFKSNKVNFVWGSRYIKGLEAISDGNKVSYIISKLKNQDSLVIKYEAVSRIAIHNGVFENLTITNNTIKECWIWENTFLTKLEITKSYTDSLMYFYNNIIPDKHNISLDESVITNLGFRYKSGYYYGNEDYFQVKERLQEEGFNENFLDLSAQYRQFISIYHENGSDFKSDAVIALKEFQTQKKMYKYYNDANIINLLNWRGGQFLGVYCDYGLNPFKALKYCFYVMLIFSIFYFFFYSDWDKIDRAFLIKRFSNIIDYFSSEKRIQDFYTDSHNEEMATFVDFKILLEEKRRNTPFFLYFISKPLYKLSLLRYKILNYLYSKAEFMAGKRWSDLNTKERYGIGLVTMIL